MEWAHKRRLIYGAGIVLAVVLVLAYALWGTLFPQPTCFDGKHNGFETGLDCGGTCALRCSQEIIPLSVVWAQAVPTSSTTYDFVGLVTNKNIDSAPENLPYAFIAYDENGTEMVRTAGTTIVPVDGDFPIVKQNISLPKPPKEVSMSIASAIPYYKVAEKPTAPTLKVSTPRYEAGSIPRVYASVTNQKRISLRNVSVRALLYDASGNVFATGETVIPLIGKEETKEVSFTWDHAFSEAPTKIRIIPILDPFLGSL